MRSLALNLPANMRIDEHAHPWPQVVFAERGALAVFVADRQWIVPTHRALWVPSGMAHVVESVGEVWLRTLYLRPTSGVRSAQGICVLDVGPLLRELILESVRRGAVDEDGPQLHLVGLLEDQLDRASTMKLALPLPKDLRARRVAERALANLQQAKTLANLADGCGASPRTLERLFLAETGLSFGQWRQQARLQFAIRRLAESAEVATVALECGYASVSAFVSMFRQALGDTPGRYLGSADPEDARHSSTTRTTPP